MRKLQILIPILLLFGANSAYAAIARDQTATTASCSPCTSLTISISPTGTDRIMFIGTMSSGNAFDGGNYLDSVAFNSASTTQESNIPHWSGTGTRIGLYCLVAPATGAHNVVIHSSVSTRIDAEVVTYTGATAQTCTPDAITTNTAGTVKFLSTSLATVNDNAWIVAMNRNSDGNFDAATSPTVMLGSADSSQMSDSNGPQTPAGTYTHRVNFATTNTNITSIVMSFAPTPTVTTPVSVGTFYLSDQ